MSIPMILQRHFGHQLVWRLPCREQAAADSADLIDAPAAGEGLLIDYWQVLATEPGWSRRTVHTAVASAAAYVFVALGVPGLDARRVAERASRIAGDCPGYEHVPGVRGAACATS